MARYLGIYLLTGLKPIMGKKTSGNRTLETDINLPIILVVNDSI